ncbi:MAG: PSD1 domain-containing protein [Planctomycetaceae bacterium]|nr:PSD1 domain-containing protein [Planctomycetaceae bacterium]
MGKQFSIQFVLTVSLCLSVTGPAGTAADPVYVRDIAPVLTNHCAECHTGDSAEADLDLSTPSGLLSGGESGPVVLPSQPDGSLLLQMIESGQMPPKEHGEKLSAEQISTVRNWIRSGAILPGSHRFPSVTSDRIEALMLLRCTVCHGAETREAGLDLRTRESMLRGGKSGPAVIAGDPDNSLLFRRIAAEEMPPLRRLVEVSIKPITSDEVRLLRDWIEAGLPVTSPVPSRARDALVTDRDREFWAFQPPRRPDVPAVKHEELVRTPIDAFIERRLEDQGLTLSPPATPQSLLRRVHLDLTGLPPTPEQLHRFLEDPSPERFAQVIDELLESPHYGVRWGRYWLDAAGYADSEGAQNEDRVRTDMWRYRDYVIRSFNSDKPYDRFLHEQIAGDELADYESADEIDQTLYDNLVATGFLRTTPDRTFANITAFVPDRLEVIADELQVFGSSVMGLTLNCARCHSHKFDPIPQRDYYRLAAVFKDAFDEHDWLKSQGPRTLPYVTTTERSEWLARKSELETEIEAQQKLRESEADPERQKEIDAQISRLRQQIPPEPRIRALWSRGRPSPTWVLLRGDYLTPGQRVEPGVPAVLNHAGTAFEYAPPWPGAQKTGRRLALARWLTQPDHPLTARVMVNRIWMHHFGTGLVDTPGNFGTTGSLPSHPELLDWLATEFVHRGWSIREIHRLILNSAVWQQSTQITDEAAQHDPDGRLLSRMPLHRMDAETVRDSMLFVTGALNEQMFGPPDGLDVRADGLVQEQQHGEGWRRSIFVMMRRTKIPSLLESFDYPQMGPNCLQRSESVVAPQALHLLNSRMVHDLADRLAERIWNDETINRADDAPTATESNRAGSLRQLVVRLYETTISRQPDQNELKAAMDAMEQMSAKWASESLSPEAADQKAFTNLCHAVLNSAAFLYID